MIPREVAFAIPWAALAVGLFVFALLVRHGVLRAGLRQRPVLLGALVVSALPPLYLALAWTGLLSETWVRLARPWVTLVGLLAVAIIALRLASSGGRASSFRKHAGDLVVGAAAIAATLAAAGFELGRPLDRLTVLITLDRSRSIELVSQADARVGHELTVSRHAMRDEDRIGTVVFAAEAATEDPPRPKSDLGSAQRVVIGRDGTDIAAGLRRALAEIPSDSAARIVIVSDGVATRGDTMAAAAAALAVGVPVDVLPLEQRQIPDVRVVALRAPPRADEGESIDLRLVTSAPAEADIEIRLSRDGVPIARSTARISAGEDVLRIRQTAPGPGLHRYDVEITALDPALDEAPEDNAASSFVRVRGQATALVIEGDPGKGAFVAGALEAAAFRVEQATGTGIPGDLGGLAGFDLVVLSDVPASALAVTQIEALASYVRDLGGGLILLGGDRSMGPGGYSRTPLEEVSPVSFDLKQEHRRGSLAEVIGIDISGSMAARAGAHTKLELANEASARSAALLGPGDLLGVQHVDTAVKWTVPLGPVTDKAAIEKAIRGVGPGGGGIYVDITLESAYAELDKKAVNLKHMLLFADGGDAERMGPCRAMVSGALKRGITTSVVALGKGSDVPELEVLSRLGGGRFYLIEDANRLPAVFAQETILAARSAIVEKDFHASPGAAASIVSGIRFEDAPPLKGYVVTIPKSRASVLLRGPEADPLLAVWSAGVGRSAAFTSDLKDRWGGAWTAWPGAARLVGQVARDVSRKEEDGRVRLEADAAGGELHVRATVVDDDGRAQSFRRLVVHVAGPEGFRRELPLEATGAGAYAASIPLSRPGTYLAIARDELSGDALGTTGAVLTAGEELRPTGSDRALLHRIADFTGGKRRDTLANVFADRGARRFAYEDLGRLLALVAGLGLVLTVGARRLAVPDGWSAWWARLMSKRRRRATVKARGPEPEATMGALLSARGRGREEREAPQGAARPDLGATPQRAPTGKTQHRPAPVAASAVASGHATMGAAPGGPAAQGGRSATGGDAPPPSSRRPLTAAEIMLARRKGRM